MSPLDSTTLASVTPRTTDGRRYPDYPRPYESYDEVLLPLLAEMQPATFDQLGFALGDAKVRAALPLWLSSAEWRGLVERRDPAMHAPRTYVVGSRAINNSRA